jgi:hypothetical protein
MGSVGLEQLSRAREVLAGERSVDLLFRRRLHVDTLVEVCLNRPRLPTPLRQRRNLKARLDLVECAAFGASLRRIAIGALANPLNDIRMVGDALKAVGFEVLPPAPERQARRHADRHPQLCVETEGCRRSTGIR